MFFFFFFQCLTMGGILSSGFHGSAVLVSHGKDWLSVLFWTTQRYPAFLFCIHMEAFRLRREGVYDFICHGPAN